MFKYLFYTTCVKNVYLITSDAWLFEVVAHVQRMNLRWRYWAYESSKYQRRTDEKQLHDAKI